MCIDEKLKELEAVILHNVCVWKQVIDGFLNMG